MMIVMLDTPADRKARRIVSGALVSAPALAREVCNRRQGGEFSLAGIAAPLVGL